MEPLTKKIVAIVLIVIIGTGVGVTAWWFLSQEEAVRYETPGVSGIPSNRIIKIGLLCDRGEIQGDHGWEGLWLSAYQINTAGGVDVNGDTYYYGIIMEDTDEAAPQLDVTKGVAAAKKIISVDGAQFIMGGFRTEALKAYLEVVMDNKILFLGTGAATDSFCENVVDAYSRYKYFFRINPHNSTAMGGQNVMFLIYLALVGMPYYAYVQGATAAALNNTDDPYYGTGLPGAYNSLNVTKVAILREDLDWTIPFADAITENVGAFAPHISFTEIPYPITATSEDFTTYINQIQSYGAQVCIPIISAQGGIKMMTQYAALEPNFLIAGVDVMAQTSEYWTDTLGGCAYEIYSHSFAGLNNTNATPLTQDFFEAFNEKFNHVPLYTGTGNYEALKLIDQAIDATQSFTTLDIVNYLETINLTNPNLNTSTTTQKFGFTTVKQGYSGAHDIIANWPYASIAYGQWHPDGKQYCVSAGESLYPALAIYPDAVVTGTLMLPPWGINGLTNL